MAKHKSPPAYPGHVVCMIVLGLVFPMGFLYLCESDHYCRAQTLAQVVPGSSSPSVENVGRLVYLQSDQLLFTPPSRDESFHMEAPPGSIIVVREVEYCQYVYKDNRVHRKWLSQPDPDFHVSSKPRNPVHLSPYPTQRSLASNFTVGEYSVDDEAMLGNRAKLQEWIPDEKSLLAFESSEASSFFHYLDNGYFYHNYSEATSKDQLTRHLSWHAGHCAAGDIRARFQVLQSSGVVSLLAKQKNVRGDLGMFRSLCGNEMAFIQSGKLSMEELFEEEIPPWIYRIPFLLVVGFSFWVSFTWEKMPVSTPKMVQILISYSPLLHRCH